MGLFSSNKSLTQTRIENETVTSTDNRVINAETKIVEGNLNLHETAGDVTILRTDHGAIEAASDIVESASLAFGNALSETTQSLAGVTESGFDLAQSAATKDSNETLNKLIFGLTIVGGLFAVRRFLK